MGPAMHPRVAPGRRWRILSRPVAMVGPPTALVVCVAVLAACSAEDEAAPAAQQPPDEHRREFLEIAEQLRAGDNRYFGMRPLEELRARLADDSLDDPHRFFELLRVTEHETNLGLLDRATRHADEAIALIAAPASRAPRDSELRKAWAAAHMQRALAYLRLAEQQNCVKHPSDRSCIFPLEGGGVHADPAAAEQAFDDLQVFLDRNPDDLGARWLLNIVAMTLGRHPDGVDPALRVDPRRHEAVDGLPRFVDAATRLGIAGFELAGGVVADDFDGDGFLDVVTSTSDPSGSLRLYHNDGDGGFSERTAAAGLDSQLGGLNLIGGDYDNDGDVDLLVLRGAWQFNDGRIRNSLLRNDGATFTDVTRHAGLALPARPTQAACWADFDQDGDLDLYVGNEAWAPAGLDFPAQMFRNNGDGTFTDVAGDAGVTNDTYAKGVTAGDYDNDGDMDLYVSNVGPNRMYRNDGNLRFTDVAPRLGLEGPLQRSFAPWFFDYDNDGDLDLFVGAYEALLEDVARDYIGAEQEVPPPALYRNEGDGTFTDVAVLAGLDRPWMPMGANFGDLDNDGFLDLYLGTGNPDLRTLVPNVALRSVGGARFEDVTVSTGLGHLQKGHGIAFADFDHDGDQDIYHQLGGFYPSDAFANALFVNPGGGGGQLVIELRGERTNRLGVGARITLIVDTPHGGREIHRAAGSVSSFGGSPSGRLEIGLGDATRIGELHVWWPDSDTRSIYHDVSPGSWIRVTEGAETVEQRTVGRFTF